MRFQGTPRLETGRLILRRFRPEDARQMYDHWASDDEVTRYLTWPTHPSVDVTRQLMDHWAKEYEEAATLHWALELKDGGAVIGDIAVVRMNEKTAEAELGWCMGRAWWGRGYMPEAARAVLQYLFDEVGFNRVMAAHDVNNPKSGRVMQKIGMKPEGVLRQAGRNNQGICDVAIYAILAGDAREAE